jgi:hypothetical protein
VTDDARNAMIAELLRVACRSTMSTLLRSDGLRRLALEENAFHHGDDPLEVDREAQTTFERAAAAHYAYHQLGIAAIVGEEAIRDIADVVEGQRVLVVDPLDGSKPWALARMGFCVAALCLRRHSDGWQIEGAIIATPTDAFTLLGEQELRFGLLDQSPASDVSLASALPENQHLGPRSWAAVGYKPADRKLAQPIVDQLPAWSFISLGGNPWFPWVVAGGLTAAVTLKASSTWDAIGILMAVATDAVVGNHEGTVVSGAAFRQLFAQVLLTGNVTPIPKMIVAKNMDCFLEIVDAIGRAEVER